MAVINWMVGWDDHYHNHFFYKRPADGRWLMMPTDLDNIMGQAEPSVAERLVLLGPVGQPQQPQRLLELPQGRLPARLPRRVHRTASQELDRTVLHPDAVADLADELAAQYQREEARTAPGGTSCGTPTERPRTASSASPTSAARGCADGPVRLKPERGSLTTATLTAATVRTGNITAANITQQHHRGNITAATSPQQHHRGNITAATSPLPAGLPVGRGRRVCVPGEDSPPFCKGCSCAASTGGTGVGARPTLALLRVGF